MMKNEKVFEICDRINKYLEDNKFQYSVYPYGLDMPVVECEINWGDWKHEHLRLKWLMEEIGCVRISSEVTEEDGSDTYSAIHRFIVDENVLSDVA